MDISIQEKDKAIADFANTLSMQGLMVILHTPLPDAQQTHCMENVLSKIKESGGRTQFGWTFNHRTSTRFGHYLFATHHAVWVNTENILVDITPFHHDPLHHPVTVNNNLLFLLDDNAKPIAKEQYDIPLPLKFYAIESNLKLKEYIKSLQEKEYAYYENTYGISRNIFMKFG